MKLRTIIALLLFVCLLNIASVICYHDSLEEYKARYGAEMDADEDEIRRKLFEDAMRKIGSPRDRICDRPYTERHKMLCYVGYARYCRRRICPPRMNRMIE